MVSVWAVRPPHSPFRAFSFMVADSQRRDYTSAAHMNVPIDYLAANRSEEHGQ
jgi:hypothetical protein